MARMWRKSLTAAVLCMVPLAGLHAQASVAGQPASLIQAWLGLPDVGNIAWPFAFIRADRTDDSEKEHRRDLFEQFDRLKWRLDAKGYTELAKTVVHWKSTLAQTDHYRQPGDWSPGWLMAHPNKRPPVSRVAAIGYCSVADSVEVWDSAGVQHIDWYAGLRLSDVLDQDHDLEGGTTDEVAVISPKGDVDHYGVAAWNYADTELIPGTRIVGAIDLKGAVFPWMRDAIAGLLAHTPAGRDCHSFPLGQGANHE